MSRASLKEQHLSTVMARWRTVIVIATWLVGAKLTFECLVFLLGLTTPASGVGFVILAYKILVWIVWGLGLWQLLTQVSISENWCFHVFVWFVALQVLIASYGVILIIDRLAGSEALPRLSPFLGGVVWGLRGVGTALAILVLTNINRLLDGALATTGGLAVVAIIGAIAIVGSGLGRMFELSDPSIVSVRRLSMEVNVLIGFWVTGIVFRISILILLIGAVRRLKRFVRTRQCPRCRYLLIVQVPGCSECGWGKDVAPQ